MSKIEIVLKIIDEIYAENYNYWTDLVVEEPETAKKVLIETKRLQKAYSFLSLIDNRNLLEGAQKLQHSL